MEELLAQIEVLKKENSTLKTKKDRAKKSRNPKSPPPRSWDRGWKRDRLTNPELPIPKDDEDFDKIFGASQIYGVLFLHGSNSDQPEFRPTPNEYSYRNIRTVIDYVMSMEENHNFWINSKRCYVHKEKGVWSTQDEVTRKKFFEQIKEKIWNKYRFIVLQSLEKAGVPNELQSYASFHMRNNPLCWTNEYLESYLDKFKDRLAVKWNSRVKGN